MQTTGAMITQKPISLKIDTKILEDLDKEAALGWNKRNWHINQAIRLYLRVMDTRRRVRCSGSMEDKWGYLQELETDLIPECAFWPVLEKYIPSKDSKP